ncbi:MAG TPA: phosphonate ABC transporter, permease protein PhnE [Bosea sp. (in: a-proteobacteria)]|jgi:phosphonate ABC transporter permease subunit PhnE|uniref:phosphonate ABC transporter, permease protein PhnE n=1 Tax=Bosea sp. (in: a-proteobacteria) TaxID=1871050 RepID=UPI002E0FC98B|nr:phosphonate ABC transporter, permease protein PhnE [Bosea sp. (in: a-proteobacteria)]
MSAHPLSADGSLRTRAFPPNWPLRFGAMLFIAYVIYAAGIVDVRWERFVQGLGNGARFLGRMLPPNLAHDKLQLLAQGMLESLQIAIIATGAGVLLALPVGLCAARNLMPLPVTVLARGLIALCRTFHPVIVAILFVKAVGFGALAGVLALIVATIGFIAKLIAEAIEEMSMKPIEALRAAGSPFLSVVIMGVVPQVLPRFIGFAAYQLDSNLRNSALVGLVGGGGIGATLFTAFQRFDYDFVLTIIIAIILAVMAGEILSAFMRRVYQDEAPSGEVKQSPSGLVWNRFTAAERGMRLAFWAVAALALGWSLQTIEVIPEFLYDAPAQTVDLFARMWPIDWAYFPKTVQQALIETLHTATLGTILAIMLATPVALMCARNVSPSAWVNTLGRFILVATRSVHTLVWALFFVAVFGPGALAGVMAVAVHSIGFTGKFLAEAIEEAKPGPIEALRAAGAPWRSVLLKGFWPQVKPAFLAVSLFRWDINVRESAVLGLVGAGGLGVALQAAMDNLYWDQVGLVLAVIFAVVVVTEIVTATLRAKII